MAVSQGSRPPFSFHDAQGKAVGIEIELVTEALRRAGRGVDFHETPNVRLLPFRDGDGVDLAVSVRGSDGGGAYFSDQFITFENVAISRRDLRNAFNRALQAMRKDRSYARIVARYAPPSSK